MVHQLSFGKINIINGNIAEITINKNIEMSLEMVEECEQFFSDNFVDWFGVLVHKIHSYEYSYEAKLTMGTHEKLKAIAVVNYDDYGVTQSKRIIELRVMDNLNVKNFSGLNLGWQQALEWLALELP